MRSSSHFILCIVLFATISRIAIPSIIGHPPNFSPIDAIALFSGAYFAQRYMAILVTLFSVWVGDVLINSFFIGHLELFYSGFYWQYASYVLIVLLGACLTPKITPTRLGLASIGSATLFFSVTNFGVWYSGLLYPFTLDGLIACYVAAIPFYKTSLLSDLVFTGALFGIYELLRKNYVVQASSTVSVK